MSLDFSSWFFFVPDLRSYLVVPSPTQKKLMFERIERGNDVHISMFRVEYYHTEKARSKEPVMSSVFAQCAPNEFWDEIKVKNEFCLNYFIISGGLVILILDGCKIV